MIFARTHDGEAHAIRVTRKGGLQITRVVEFPQEKVGSVAEAEKIVLGLAGEAMTLPTEQATPLGRKVALMRASNMIASKSRRGAGNLILIPRGEDWGQEALVEYDYLDVEVHSEVEPNTAYVIYRTERDGPAFLIEKDGELYVTPASESDAYMGKPSDYMMKVVVE